MLDGDNPRKGEHQTYTLPDDLTSHLLADIHSFQRAVHVSTYPTVAGQMGSRDVETNSVSFRLSVCFYRVLESNLASTCARGQRPKSRLVGKVESFACNKILGPRSRHPKDETRQGIGIKSVQKHDRSALVHFNTLTQQHRWQVKSIDGML